RAGRFDPRRRPRSSEPAVLFGTKCDRLEAARRKFVLELRIAIVPSVVATLAPEQAGADEHLLARFRLADIVAHAANILRRELASKRCELGGATRTIQARWTATARNRGTRPARSRSCKSRIFAR